ncbi:MAG: NUDIX domain-containing protein [Anaerolineales bacterium]|nr:NUDIX domain-containing protein [Chloroflexota bacterium]MBL6981323.1 NUDIX domain-containing protein [Anaerolineales bacterium]
MFTLGAFVIIFDDQRRILLCHRRDYDIWNLPGGGVESGELPTEAAVREVQEETGLEIKLERLIGVYGKSYRDEIVFVFEGIPISGNISPTDESDSCSYFEIEEFPINTIPRHVERVHDAIENYSEPIFRCQSGTPTLDYLKQLGKI